MTDRREFLMQFGCGLSGLTHKTNDISAMYLASAIAGEVSERLTELARAIGTCADTRQIRTVTHAALEVGCTSGADGVLGLLAGISVWSSIRFDDEALALPVKT